MASKVVERTEDLNKTPLTQHVTASAVEWLDGRGFKPVETEVPVAVGWVADVAGVLDATRTEALKLKLIPRRPPWSVASFMNDHEACARAHQEWDQQYLALPSPISALVEVKTSRSDLTRDHKWSKTSPADLSFLAVPHDLASMAQNFEPASEWGLLDVTKGGARLVRVPRLRPTGQQEHLTLIYQVALRRDHRTRRVAVNEMRKRERVRLNAEHYRPERWNQTFRAAMMIARGGGDLLGAGTLEDVLRWYRCPKLAYDVRQQLDLLWGVLGAEKGKPNGDQNQ